MKLFRRCPHINLRCVHGDEINHRNTRTICMDCGKALKRLPLPYKCYYTGDIHPSYKKSEEQ